MTIAQDIIQCSRRFSISNKLEQLEFKQEKKYWDLKTCRKKLEIVICTVNGKCPTFPRNSPSHCPLIDILVTVTMSPTSRRRAVLS